MAVVTTNLGTITAYGDAVAAGYTGTKAQWQALMANYATVGQQAAQDAQTASQAAQTATTKAGEASQSATAAAASAASITTPDATLTQAGVAADAKATGDEISDLKENFNDIAPAIIETVSGAVASFTDGADGLPMDISVDSASASAVITKTGKNLSAPLASGSNTAKKGLTAVFDGNGRITITGTTTETNADTPNKYFGGNTVIPIKLVGGRTYTISIDGTFEVSNDEVRIRLMSTDNTSIWTANSGTGSWSITPESDFVANRLAVRFARSGNVVNIDGYIQIEEGDTATAYEAFDGQMVTATLVNGVVQEELTSKKGINHVWSDADVTVSYRADTKLYIDKRLGV